MSVVEAGQATGKAAAAVANKPRRSAVNDGSTRKSRTVRYIRAVHNLEYKLIHLRSDQEDHHI